MLNNFHKAYLSALFMIPSMIALRLILILMGLVTVPLGVTYCMVLGKERFPKILWLWDNEEDGFDGNRLGWYDNYLHKEKGKDKNVSGFKRWLRSVNWSMLRNPVNNMQRAKYISWSAEDPQDVEMDYNHEEQEWVIAFKPKDSFFYHLCLNKHFKHFSFRTGLKLKPWYYPEYGGRVLEIEKSRKRTTYTISVFLKD